MREWIPGVERVLRVLSTPVHYAMVVEGRRVELGPVDTLLSQRRFRAKVVESLNVLPRWLDQRYWDSMAQAVLDAAEEVEAPEAEELDLLRAWLEAYLEERSPAQASDPQNYEAHLRLELPVITPDGEVAVNAVNMATWIGDSRGAKIQPRALALLLRRYGAEARKLQVWKEGRNRTKRYWLIPSTLLPEWARGLGEELEPSQNPSHIVGWPEQVTRGFSPVEDAKNEGSSHIVGEKIAPTPSQVSDYVTRPQENSVQDGDNSLVTWTKSSDYVTRLDEPKHTSESETQEKPSKGEIDFTKKEVGNGKVRLVLEP
ncbi:MAG: hypothetical protein NZN28_11925 [Meiothermus sp.]|uniref:hypothetical protein n=1 Tax=Meiothermus sp. TaxID=1955249 RepID=UPI0025CEB6F0|nr:hypothetical protein [Meiothermus sp.]MCS7069320.1 hypothetical protein [Meiothermus sp.]